VSYLLHPPLLDEVSLQSELRWYIEGFAERSKIKVTMEIRDEDRGIDPEIQSKLDSGATIGVGFRGMKERASLVGGMLTVRSSGKGTSVVVVLPLAEGDAAPESVAEHGEVV
jgi:signal transduction histidine kinase